VCAIGKGKSSLNLHRPTGSRSAYMCPVCAMIMHIKGIAGAAYSGTTKSSVRIPTLLHHLYSSPHDNSSRILCTPAGIKGLLFIIWAVHFHVDSRRAQGMYRYTLLTKPASCANTIGIKRCFNNSWPHGSWQARQAASKNTWWTSSGVTIESHFTFYFEWVIIALVDT